MNTQQDRSSDYQENEKLYLENLQLKKELEKEEFLHKTLYKQWNELSTRMLAKERELKQVRSGNLFYKYAFYIILFLAAPAYYLLSSSKGDKKILPASQTVSSPKTDQALTTDSSVTVSFPTPTINQAPATKPDSMQVSVVKPTEKKIIQSDTVKPKLTTVNKPVIKPLSDSEKNLIYSEGWDAYHEKSGNPYQKSTEKYKVWMQGWKDAEADDRKALTKNLFDTLK